MHSADADEAELQPWTRVTMRRHRSEAVDRGNKARVFEWPSRRWLTRAVAATVAAVIAVLVIEAAALIIVRL